MGYSPWGRKESDTTEQLYFLSLKHIATFVHYSLLYAFIFLNHLTITDIKFFYLQMFQCLFLKNEDIPLNKHSNTDAIPFKWTAQLGT